MPTQYNRKNLSCICLFFTHVFSTGLDPRSRERWSVVDKQVTAHHVHFMRAFKIGTKSCKGADEKMASIKVALSLNMQIRVLYMQCIRLQCCSGLRDTY